MRPERVVTWNELEPLRPTHALVGGVDLVVIRWSDGENVSVLYGRCLHRGALLGDGSIEGDNLVCGLHHWDYRYRSGVSEYHNDERLERFTAWVDNGSVWVDADEVEEWRLRNPQPYRRDEYQGPFQDPAGTPEEPYVRLIRQLADRGVSGKHGAVAAMGVPRDEVPTWDTIQLVTAQLATVPLLDDAAVATDLIVGPAAAKPLQLDIPIFVSDMSFGALSLEAKVALARGAELAGTGIASGEGGVLPEEAAESTRYFYELGSAMFGFTWEAVGAAQAFHFKGGQAAKTGTGGHLPGDKVVGRIAEVRGLAPGQAAISPSRFPDWTHPGDFRAFAEEVRERAGGIPVGFKLSAQHIEADLEAALEAGADYIILDGRGGGTGAAPLIFRDNISVPTIPALARARRHLDQAEAHDVTLIITGGLRTPADFVKALALGADGIAVSNSALQAIGCLGMRACHTNNCPVGIATQREHFRARLPVDEAAHRLARFLGASVELMQTLARACGHAHLNEFAPSDLTTFDPVMAELSGISFGGVSGAASVESGRGP